MKSFRNKHNLFVVFSFCILLLTGCLKFGDEISTEALTPEQLKYCFSTLCLNEDIKVVPLGYKLNASGIDDAIWFKFKTNTSDYREIFKEELTDAISFKKDYKFSPQNAYETWWNPKDTAMIGGQIELPGLKYMEVGISESNTPGEYIIYIFWFEV